VIRRANGSKGRERGPKGRREKELRARKGNRRMSYFRVSEKKGGPLLTGGREPTLFGGGVLSKRKKEGGKEYSGTLEKENSYNRKETLAPSEKSNIRGRGIHPTNHTPSLGQ